MVARLSCRFPNPKFIEVSKKIINYSAMKNDIDNSFNISELVQYTNPNDLYVHIYEKMTYLIDKHTSLKINKINAKHFLTPWINKELGNLIRYKNKLLKLIKKKPDRMYLKDNFDKINLLVKKLIDESRNNYFKNKVNACGSDTKKLWSFLNNMLGKSCNHSISKIIDSNGQILNDNKSIADCLNNYFSSIGLEMLNQISSTTDGINFYNSLIHNNNSLLFDPTSKVEVKNLILTLN